MGFRLSGSLATDWLPEAHGTRVPRLQGEQDFLQNINVRSFDGTFENPFGMRGTHRVEVN